MPITHQQGEQFPLRLTLANALSTDSLVQLNGNISNGWNSHQSNNYGYSIQKPEKFNVNPKSSEGKIMSVPLSLQSHPLIQQNNGFSSNYSNQLGGNGRP
jgi:hypothetical protein